VATVITKWKANEHFSFGYVRAEVLAGFINGLFLLFISFFIFSEAIERLIEPPEVKHERLFVISVLGFIVNLIGIYAFQHGHAHGGGGSHSHGGGSSHSHGGSHSHGLMDHHGHSHDGGHGHAHNGNNNMNSAATTSHNSQIMQGVFLHILADTLGSVGVIISAALMWAFGWMIADPICSIFIAILIFVSVLALIRESVVILMQRQPRELDHLLPPAYQKIQQLDGVLSVQEPHFWTLCSNTFVGSIKIEIERTADPRYISAQAHFIFSSIGVKQCYVQLDYSLT
jgi:zinc transporter 5/7